MFLAELDPKERRAFLALAKVFMSQDGECRAEEAAMLAHMCAEMDLDVDGAGSPTPHSGDTQNNSVESDLFASFASNKSRVIALLELIGLGHADSEYCATEEAFITRMSNAFEVPQADLAAMENWVVRQLLLVAEARAFMEEGA